LVLAVIALAEYGVMQALPFALPSHWPRLAESLIDAAVLSLVVSPVLWWAIVRPLQRATALRNRYVIALFAAIEDERRRIAHELHDDVGQTLTLIVSGLRSAETTSALAEGRRHSLEELAERALTSVKQMALGLRPSLLDDLGLAPAMERVGRELQKHHPLNLKLDVQTLAGARLPAEVETALFRIFQEALNNVVKHSQASQVGVKLQRVRNGIELEVADNGRGFAPVEPASASLRGGHLGIIGMRERAGQLGGELTIASQPGRGTCVRAFIPGEPVRK
jgi:signal transduction histidine kinase